MSQQREATVLAYDKGYRVVGGEVYSAKGNKRKLYHNKKNTTSYYLFSIRGEGRKHLKVHVHKLVAYQLFGEASFESGIHVRHLDGNSLNNLESNIAIGTQSDNEMDKSPEERMKHSINAAAKLRKFTDSQMEEIKSYYRETLSYTKTKEKFNISSSGSLHYLLNRQYKTKVS